MHVWGLGVLTAEDRPTHIPQVSGLLALKKELAALIGAPADAKKKKGKQ